MNNNYIEQKKNSHLYFQIGDYKYAINTTNVLEIIKLPALDYPQKLPNKVVGLLKYNNFKIKKFVDFFDEDVTRDEAINVDYIYLFSNIIKTFITNFNLQHKIEYQYQALNNGTPNVQIDTTDLYDNIKEES